MPSLWLCGSFPNATHQTCLRHEQDARGDQCDGCSRTLDAIELVKPRCLVNETHIVTRRTSAHMYLKLDVIQSRTEEWIKESYMKGKWSVNATINTDGEIVDARLKSGLLPTPLTRDLSWGVPVPIEGEDTYGMKGKVLCKSACLKLLSSLCSLQIDVWVRIHSIYVMITTADARPHTSLMPPSDTQV